MSATDLDWLNRKTKSDQREVRLFAVTATLLTITGAPEPLHGDVAQLSDVVAELRRYRGYV